MQRFRRIMGLFVLVATFCCCAVPGVDLHETAFDEADLAISPALPLQPRVDDVSPVTVLSAVLPTLPLDCVLCRADRFVVEPVAAPNLLPPRSRQDLLCTFLI